jgi:AcrR family transcriptional regulator
MALQIGLRARKKQRTRQLIFDAAQKLFAERGFEAVSVAEIARAADVSEVTVFNYFPTKEDLFYGGMAAFEESLLEAVRARRPGEAASKAFRQALLDSADNLVSKERAAAITKASKLIAASPSLLARERAIAERYTLLLAELLAQETGSNPDEVEAMAVASALMGAHRAGVAYVRKEVLAGRKGAALAEAFRAQVTQAFARLERGLGSYAVSGRPSVRP